MSAQLLFAVRNKLYNMQQLEIKWQMAPVVAAKGKWKLKDKVGQVNACTLPYIAPSLGGSPQSPIYAKCNCLS